MKKDLGDFIASSAMLQDARIGRRLSASSPPGSRMAPSAIVAIVEMIVDMLNKILYSRFLNVR